VSTPGPSTACITLSRDSDAGFLVASLDPRGAGIRALSLGGSPLVQSYPEEAEAPYFSGQTLFPWPNRLAQGSWTYEGLSLTLPLTDEAHQAALHGLLSSTVYGVREVTSSSVVLVATVEASAGYPFTLDIAVHYVLEGSGLLVTYEVVNRSDRLAPFAVGAHPFLRAGKADVSTLTLTSEVGSYLTTDDNLIPVDEVTLAPGDVLNLDQGVALADVTLDTTFRVAPGRDTVVTRLVSPTGHQTELWQDSAWGWVQIFLTSLYPTGTGNVWAVAVEPMTAPPNALATGEDVVWLMPHNTWRASWGIRGTLP